MRLPGCISKRPIKDLKLVWKLMRDVVPSKLLSIHPASHTYTLQQLRDGAAFLLYGFTYL
jgi:hypothetical protein